MVDLNKLLSIIIAFHNHCWEYVQSELHPADSLLVTHRSKIFSLSRIFLFGCNNVLPGEFKE